ncbi:hypothetical protein L0337_07255 [candidate division KSB1 bacterium]|nr:hypothetical protein [candidate division KSB1 bacterium]
MKGEKAKFRDAGGIEQLVPAAKLNIRIDLGWGKGSSGFYLALAEAF